MGHRQLLVSRGSCWVARSGGLITRRARGLGLTKSAALEYVARGIRINAMCPGLIWTPMADRMVAAGQAEAIDALLKSVPMGRYGRPEEMVAAGHDIHDGSVNISGRRFRHAMK